MYGNTSEGYHGELHRPYEEDYATAADVMREMREDDVEEDKFGDGMGVETDGVRDDFSELPLLSSSWSSPEATREAIHDDITILGSLSYDSSNSISRASLKLQLEDFVENRLLRRAGIRVGGIRSASDKASNALCLAGFFNDGSGPDRPGWLPPDASG